MWLATNLIWPSMNVLDQMPSDVHLSSIKYSDCEFIPPDPYLNLILHVLYRCKVKGGGWKSTRHGANAQTHFILPGKWLNSRNSKVSILYSGFIVPKRLIKRSSWCDDWHQLWKLNVVGPNVVKVVLNMCISDNLLVPMFFGNPFVFIHYTQNQNGSSCVQITL